MFSKFVGNQYKNTVHFDDSYLASNCKPSEIVLYADENNILGISIVYTDVLSYEVSKPIANHFKSNILSNNIKTEKFCFDFDEYIIGIKGRSSKAIESIQFITNKGAK